MKLFASIVIWLMLCQPLLAAEVTKATPEPIGGRDCSACHPQAASLLATSGARHVHSTGCVYCHKVHPPTDAQVTTPCSQCHTGDSPHYHQPDCKGCHMSAHAPLQIRYLNDCLGCHGEVNAKLQQNASKHSRLACTKCHVSSSTKPHGFIPDCRSCHKPHDADQTAADCRKCHDAHMPNKISYEMNTPSRVCGACHNKAYKLLTASKAKHSKIVCAGCHQTRHKMVPKCQDCHHDPHAAKANPQASQCRRCHNIAHDLSDPTSKTNKE